MELTAEKLRELLNYDPETGVFTWRRNMGAVVKAGDVAGSVHNGYCRIAVCGRKVMAHCLAWLYVTGEWPAGMLDHKNGIRSDNRWDNLRPSNNSMNMENQRRARADSKTGLLGVKINKKGHAAKIASKGITYWLGTYKTPEEAHQVYLAKKRQIHEGYTI